MKYQLLICWPGIYHDDSELWRENDDGTYAKPAAVFTKGVIVPTLKQVLAEFGCVSPQIRISDGEHLVSAESDAIDLSTASREQHWDTYYANSTEADRKYLESEVPEGKTVHFQLLVEGENNDQKDIFSEAHDGASLFSYRLMQELAKREMLAIYVLGDHTDNQSPVIDYLYSEDMNSVSSSAAFCGDNLGLLKKAWNIRGELADSFVFFSKAGSDTGSKSKLFDLPSGSFKRIQECFDADPDIVLGDPLKLILIRSGDGPRDYSISLEIPVIDDDGNPEEYEIVETFGSSEDSLRSAIEAYLHAGGELRFISELL